MRIVSPFLKKVLYPSLAAAGVFERTANGGLAVVTYHGVRPAGYGGVDAAFDGNLVTAQAMRKQLRLLKSRYSVIAPEEVLAWREGRQPLPAKAVLLTCDDGLLNHLTDMLPILQEQELKCLFFVTGASAADRPAQAGPAMLWYEELFLILLRAPGGHFGIACNGGRIEGELGAREQRRVLWWRLVQRLSQLDASQRALFLVAARMELGLGSGSSFSEDDAAQCRRFRLLNSAQLRQLAAAGMTVGAHTMSHPLLSQSPLALAHSEIADSRARLEEALQRPVWAFAYPFGDANSVTPEVLTIPEQTGFQAAFLNYGGGLGVALPPFALPRVHVTANMGLAEFEALVSGFYATLRQSVGRGA